MVPACQGVPSRLLRTSPVRCSVLLPRSLLLSFASKDEELRVHLVEIAIGILRADPKEDVASARGWAIDVIEKDSGDSFNAARAAHLRKPIKPDLGEILHEQGYYKQDIPLPHSLNEPRCAAP